MPEQERSAPENFFGLTDQIQLDRLAASLAANRLHELETRPPLKEFTRQSLQAIHRFLLQDVYPWAGQIRTTEVAAMGFTMCRAQFVDAELDRVMAQIARSPISHEDRDQAVRAVADHWSELTIVHPFRDGNSRTQRFFFDQMLRNAGWVVDWSRINAAHAHAARYVGAATGDPAFLAQVLSPGVFEPEEFPIGAAGSLTQTEGQRDPGAAAEAFRSMMHFRRAHPGQPWRP